MKEHLSKERVICAHENLVEEKNVCRPALLEDLVRTRKMSHSLTLCLITMSFLASNKHFMEICGRVFIKTCQWTCLIIDSWVVFIIVAVRVKNLKLLYVILFCLATKALFSKRLHKRVP